MNERFYEGQEVKSIVLYDGRVMALSRDIEKITVVMENGQMAGVSWFAIWSNGKIKNKYNGALLESVEL